jgi:hypothetical protein
MTKKMFCGALCLPAVLALGLSNASAVGYHYNRNAETYMEVGNALGWAMADMLKAVK